MSEQKMYAILFGVNEIENVQEMDYDCYLEPIAVVTGHYDSEFDTFVDDNGEERYSYSNPEFIENSAKYVVGEIRTLKDIKKFFPEITSTLDLKKAYFNWSKGGRYYCKYNPIADIVDIICGDIEQENDDTKNASADVKIKEIDTSFNSENLTVFTALDFDLIDSIDNLPEMRDYLIALMKDKQKIKFGAKSDEYILIADEDVKKLLNLDLNSIKMILKSIYEQTKEQLTQYNNETKNLTKEALEIYFNYFNIAYQAIEVTKNMDEMKKELKDILEFCSDSREQINEALTYTTDNKKYKNLMILLNVYISSMKKLLGFNDVNKIKEIYHALYTETYATLKAAMEDFAVEEKIEEQSDEKEDSTEEISIDKESTINEMIEKVEKSMSKLNQMIGLEKVKNQINIFKNLKIYETVASRYIKQEDNRINMVFYGNPGTGKTTVARLLGEIFYALGYTKTAKVTECTATDLIGEYVGHTGPKTKKLFNANRGGIIFIDEAYGLVSKGNTSFSDDAIVELLKEFEKGEIIFILAGYRDEMKQFIDSNPGLKNRINYYFDYEDYTEEELYDIFIQKIENLKNEHSESGYTIDESIKEQVMSLIKMAKGKKYFSNGRFVDNLVKSIISSHANRIVKERKFAKEDILTIKDEDITEDSISNLDLKEKVKVIGFRG